MIIQEAKRKLDSPGSLAHETLHELLFDRHRIRRWRIGTEAALAGFTRERRGRLLRIRYVPRRTIVAIVGDVDPRRRLEAARARYAGWPARPRRVDPSPEEPDHREVRARTLRGPITLAQLALGWRTVPPLHPDAAALDLAAAVLGSGRGSWLYRGVRAPGPGHLGVGLPLRTDGSRRLQRCAPNSTRSGCRRRSAEIARRRAGAPHGGAHRVRPRPGARAAAHAVGAAARDDGRTRQRTGRPPRHCATWRSWTRSSRSSPR